MAAELEQKRGPKRWAWSEGLALLALNAAIIASIELLEDYAPDYSQFVTGGLVILFALLVAVRVISHYKFHDPMLKKFLDANLIAMAVIAIAHVLDLATDRVLELSPETGRLDIVNLYLVSFLVTTIAVEIVLTSYAKRSRFTIWIPLVASLILIAVSIVMPVYNWSIHMDLSSPVPFAYLAVTLALAVLATEHLLTIREHIPYLKSFAAYMVGGTILVCVAILPLLFLDIAVDRFEASPLELLNFRHFTLFAALSLMFLSFGKLAKPTGIYADFEGQPGLDRK